MKTVITLLLLVLLGVGGYWYFTRDNAVEAEPTGEEAVEGEVDDETPVSIEATLVFAGTLPAASSAGIETTLTLTDRGDGIGGGFMLMENFIDEEDGMFESSGQWELKTEVIEDDPEASVYVLTSEEDAEFETRYYEIVDEDTIRQLASDATRIESELPYELELQ